MVIDAVVAYCHGATWGPLANVSAGPRCSWCSPSALSALEHFIRFLFSGTGLARSTEQQRPLRIVDAVFFNSAWRGGPGVLRVMTCLSRRAGPGVTRVLQCGSVRRSLEYLRLSGSGNYRCHRVSRVTADSLGRSRRTRRHVCILAAQAVRRNFPPKRPRGRTRCVPAASGVVRLLGGTAKGEPGS